MSVRIAMPKQNERGRGLMSRRKLETPDSAAVEHLIEEITVDAYGEAEQLWAFHQAFEDAVAVPFNAVVIGEPVSVIGFDCDGNEKRGLTARCRRGLGSRLRCRSTDVALPDGVPQMVGNHFQLAPGHQQCCRE
jgi:hypothetical protein